MAAMLVLSGAVVVVFERDVRWDRTKVSLVADIRARFLYQKLSSAGRACRDTKQTILAS